MKRLPILRTILGGLACVAILMGGLGGFLLLANLREPPPEREATQRVFNVEVFNVERLTLQEILKAYGTARADRVVTVSAQVAGEIVETHPHLKVGQSVEADRVTLNSAGESLRLSGELLIRVDPDMYRQKLELAEKRLAEDDAALGLLEAQESNVRRLLTRAEKDLVVFREQHARIVKLNRDGISTDAELSQSQLELARYEQTLLEYQNELTLFEIRQEQVAVSRATHVTEMSLAQLDLKHTDVRPPFSGALSNVFVELGQYVRPGDPIVELLDLSLIRIPLALSQEDYLKLNLGNDHPRPRVGLATLEHGDPIWTGELARMSPRGDERTRTREAFVEVKNEEGTQLLPGTFLHARIDGPVLSDVLVVPRDCVINQQVFVARGDHAVAVDVSVLRNLESLTVISSGLQPGDQVVLTNLDILADGSRINVQASRTLASELDRMRFPSVRVLGAPVATTP